MHAGWGGPSKSTITGPSTPSSLHNVDFVVLQSRSEDDDEWTSTTWFFFLKLPFFLAMMDVMGIPRHRLEKERTLAKRNYATQHDPAVICVR